MHLFMIFMFVVVSSETNSKEKNSFLLIIIFAGLPYLAASINLINKIVAYYFS